jgi:Domain of unknown function (DUF4145)
MDVLDEKLYCRGCGKKTNHISISKIKSEYFPRETIFSIVQCAGCDLNSYATFLNWTEKKIVHKYPEEPKVSRNLFPQFWSQVSNNIPENIKELYIQLIESYNNKHNILSALGIRTLIESICLNQNVDKGTLFTSKDQHKFNKKGLVVISTSLEGKIFGLYENRFIIWEHCLILQRIREIGNAATHELISPTSDELYSAIEIIEKLIENVYELQNHELLRK